MAFLSSSLLDCLVRKSSSARCGKTLIPPCVFLIFAVGSFAHWPALISDSLMWDDWIILSWITQKRLDWAFHFFNNYGVTPYILIYFPFISFINNSTFSILVSKILSFVGVIINAVLIMLISRRVAHGNLLFATLAGIAAVCFPALSGEGFHFSMLIYVFFIPIFLVGIFLFILVSSSLTSRVFVRVIGLSTLFLSFSLNSLLVMFYALIPAVFYASLEGKTQNLRELLLNLKVFVIRHLDFLVLPLVFWGIKEIYMPRLGMYARYNKIHFDWLGILRSYEQLIPNISQTIFLVPLSIQLIPWIAGAIFIIVACRGKPVLNYIGNDNNTTNYNFIILFGLGFLALCGAALPYYLVGRRAFQAFGFMSRDSILFPLPVGWIMAAFFCLLLSSQSLLKTSKTWNLTLLRQRLALGAFAAIIVSQSLSNWRNHIDWQAHYAYYRSVIEKISQDKLVSQASVIQIIDQLPGDRTLLTYKYPTAIWTKIIASAYQKTTRLAIPFPPENKLFFTQTELKKYAQGTECDFLFQDINLKGPQIQITIEPAIDIRSPIRLALTYWKIRFFSPRDMGKFLDSLTRVKIERLADS